MVEKIRIEIREVNGETVFSPEGMALIFGVPLDTTEFPPELFRQGKRRAREAFAAIGDEDMWKAMQYWAREDYNSDVEFEVLGVTDASN